MPELSGVSHVSLTVTDLAESRTFWTDVMGFTAVADRDGFCLVVHLPTLTSIGLKCHDHDATYSFDERRPGLDHLSFTVSDRTVLEQWQACLQARAVRFTPIEESEVGLHLNLRAPDDLPIELFVLDDRAARDLLPGIFIGESATAP